mmetsp:Transcript_21460/g.44776  ORF Transcript_21460/g.44776 Transcript_21460/m.44776 type:complete len:285 (-) Transcript_21460:325-1179(-)
MPTTTTALLRTPANRLPNSRLQQLSSTCSGSHAMLTTTDVYERPPKLERSSIVNVESRYGTCEAPVPNARITLPRAVNDPLIDMAWEAAWPSTILFLIRSDPARSTNKHCRFATLPPDRSTTCTVTRQCDRDDLAFRACPVATLVASTVRASLAMSAGLCIGQIVSPETANDSPSAALPPPRPPPPPPRAPPLTPPRAPRPLLPVGGSLVPSRSSLSFRFAASSFAFSFARKHSPQKQVEGWVPWPPPLCMPSAFIALPFLTLPAVFVPTVSGAWSFNKSNAKS